jgi:hypothetical protein
MTELTLPTILKKDVSFLNMTSLSESDKTY